MSDSRGMRWDKAPDDLAARFSATLQRLPGAQVKKMFGYPAAFANGYNFTGLHQDRWVIRLAPDAATEFSAAGGTSFEPMPGRPMRGYLIIPEPMTHDPDALQPWLERAMAHVLSLPPK